MHVRVVDVLAHPVEDQQARLALVMQGGMVVVHPGIFEQAQHGEVAEQLAVLHVGEVTGDRRVLGIQPRIGLFEGLAILRQGRVLFRIDEAGFEEEVP